MAVCAWCSCEMMRDDAPASCAGNSVVAFPDGESLAALPFSDETFERCPDCGVAGGGHHHPGCDNERCPRCDGQLIGCGCLDEPDTEDKPEAPVPPSLVALLVVAGLCITVWAGAPIVAEFVGAYFAREPASSPAFDVDAGGP